MNRVQASRWVSRLVAIGMIGIALLALKIVERQLRRLGELAESDRARPPAEAPAVELPQPPSARLPPPQPADETAAGELDPETGSSEAAPSDEALAEVPPEPGRIPEGAIW